MSTIMQAKSAKPAARELSLWDQSAKPGAREHDLQTKSANHDACGQISPSWPDKDAPACAQSQTVSGKDDYDERILLMHKAFNEIAKICYWNDYSLDGADWELLDAARLDRLPYEELRAALVHAYKQIKRKSVKVTNHTRFRSEIWPR